MIWSRGTNSETLKRVCESHQNTLCSETIFYFLTCICNVFGISENPITFLPTHPLCLLKFDLILFKALKMKFIMTPVLNTRYAMSQKRVGRSPATVKWICYSYYMVTVWWRLLGIHYKFTRHSSDQWNTVICFTRYHANSCWVSIGWQSDKYISSLNGYSFSTVYFQLFREMYDKLQHLQ